MQAPGKLLFSTELYSELCRCMSFAEVALRHFLLF